MTPSATIVSLVDLLEDCVKKFGPHDLFGVRRESGWVFISYADFGERVAALRAGLASLGVTQADKIGIIANNRIEWAVAAYASYGLGAAFVPMYESQLEKDWEFIARDSG